MLSDGTLRPSYLCELQLVVKRKPLLSQQCVIARTNAASLRQNDRDTFHPHRVVEAPGGDSPTLHMYVTYRVKLRNKIPVQRTRAGLNPKLIVAPHFGQARSRDRPLYPQEHSTYTS
jgi:hypothetical protein